MIFIVPLLITALFVNISIEEYLTERNYYVIKDEKAYNCKTPKLTKNCKRVYRVNKR